MTETEQALADLEARVTKMRELRVTRWGDLEIELGPVDTSSEDDAQNGNSATPKSTERHRSRSVGRLVPVVQRTP